MILNPRRMRSPDISTKIVLFTGGLNESISNLEMKAGALSECNNYMELEGLTHGYTSAPGYERYDGRALASSVSVVTDANGDVTSDTAREAARALITEVPGEGTVWGVYVYDSKVYAFRNGTGETDCNMYVESAAGWVLVKNFSNPISQQIDFTTFRFSLFSSNKKIMIWSDGSNDVQTFDGTTVIAITTPTASVPYLVGAWKNRLFIALPNGHMFFSALGDPTDFSTATVTGEIYIGEDITAIKDAPGGTLVIASKNSIQILYYESTTADFIFRMEEFSAVSGMIEGTVERMLGTLYYADDRGVTTLEATDAYGDFATNTLAKKVQKTYQASKASIIASSTDRERNQYQLFMEGGAGTLGLIFTFENKRLRGTTKIEYPHTMSVITTGKDVDNEDISYFGSTNGFVYKMKSGTSFDGELIVTRLATAFHPYNTPTKWKDFKSLLFELSADSKVEIVYRAEFDYLASGFPQTTPESMYAEAGGGTWDVSLWDSFLWEEAYLSQITQRIVGFGTNMRILITTSDKYRDPHTLHNVITEYVIGGRRL